LAEGCGVHENGGGQVNRMDGVQFDWAKQDVR
jgi:hypothetical protein